MKIETRCSYWTGVVVLLGLLVNAPAYAQVGANVGGVVRDDSDAVLPGVTITVTNTATGTAQSLVTSDEGRYRAVTLQPGPYEIAAELAGFGTVRRGIVLVVGADATVDITLGVATLAESITVVGEAPLIEVAKSQPSSVITSQQLASLPVLSRNFLVLAQLLPGSGPGQPNQRFSVTRFGAVSDQRTAYTTIIDGGAIDDPIWGHPLINMSQEAVSEFKVHRNQFDAEYGAALTAIVTVVTKAGTNRMSGGAFYFGRDKRLNARNAFATEASVPPFKQARVGGSFGGPIVQNRTHFFTAFERLDVDSAVITALPATNPFAALENGVYPTATSNQNFDARVDHRFNEAHNMFVRYAWDDQTADGGDRPVRVVDGITLGPLTSIDYTQAHSVVVQENWILSSRTVNTLRVHWLKNDIKATPHSFELAINRPSFSWGQVGFHPQHFPTRQLSVFDTFFINTEKHDLKIGGDYTYDSNGLDAHFNEHGLFTFTTDAPFDANNPATWPFSFTQRAPGFHLFVTNLINGYVQDTWRVRNRVTLNVGLRYVYNSNLRNNEFHYGLIDNPVYTGIENFISRDRGNYYNTMQPRLGAAWDVRGNGTLVGRAGWGRYVTRDRAWFHITGQDQVVGGAVIIQDPQRLRFFPDINAVLGGQPLASFAATSGARSLVLTPDDFGLPQQYTTTVGVGWQVTGTTSLDADYVHGQASNQLGYTDRNLPPTGAISASNPRPVPAFGRVVVHDKFSKSWYDALEMQIRQRVRGGNSLQVSYTLSRSWLDGVERELTLRGTQRTPQEVGYNSTDTRHNLAVSASASLFWGIHASAIARGLSGSPTPVNVGIDLDGDQSTAGDRPRGLQPKVGRGNVNEELRIINEYRASVGLAPFTKDRLKLYPFRSIDFRFTKSFSLRREQRIEMFLEAFNLTNFVNYNPGNGIMRLATFLIPTTAQPARQVQWGARFSF